MNVVALFSRRTRKASFVLAAVSFAMLLVDALIGQAFIDSRALLWVGTLGLTITNFSKLGKEKRRDRVSRYLALKLSFGFTIGLLMSVSLMSILFGRTFVNTSLLFALLSNVVCLVAQHIFYWRSNAETGIGDESFEELVREQRSLLYSVAVASLLTLGLIFLLTF